MELTKLENCSDPMALEGRSTRWLHQLLGTRDHRRVEAEDVFDLGLHGRAAHRLCLEAQLLGIADESRVLRCLVEGLTQQRDAVGRHARWRDEGPGERIRR